MGTDRARRSFDASRMYRSVVSQQGRVTLEADANEAEEIRTAESRAELIDLIGPTGTPDDGFKISVPGDGPFDFAIAAGILYLGGVRVVQGRPSTYLAQNAGEWADYPAGAPAPYPTSNAPFTELVYLAVTEQEISAVEDRALREVALGGPDTAGRTRLVQRVQRALASGTDCEAALIAAVKQASPGLAFDPATTRLDSAARLKVDFVPVPSTDDPCQPTAQAGFLGAENQLIRVQVTDDGKLLWGYDNASFLYRATVQSDTTLALQGTPVDVYHRPRANQWVEVLAVAVNLGPDAHIASSVGTARALASYEPTGNVITLTVPLPATLPANTEVFVRMWENRLAFVGDGTTATELVTPEGPSTGVRVTTSGAAVPGDYWMVGVRPSTPTVIFPARLASFQPPDGPGRWATPLATIAWKLDVQPAVWTTVVHDCRRPFDNLVELTRMKCCELKLSPGDDLQKLINDRIRWNVAHRIQGLHVRFASGAFTLDRPLTISGISGGDLTVSGCGLSTKIVAATSETALRIRGWNTASVSDLSITAGVARPGGEFRNLGGALTILDCRASVVERIVATCADGDRRAASCVTIRNADNQPGSALVRSCELWVGARQVGALLVNVDRGTVEDNRIQWSPSPSSTEPTLVSSRTLISNVRVGGGTQPQLGNSRVEGKAVPLWGDKVLQYVTEKVGAATEKVGAATEKVGAATEKVGELAAAWAAAFDSLGAVINPPERPPSAKFTNKDRYVIQRVIAAAVAQILQPNKPGPLGVAQVRQFRVWIDKVQARPPVPVARAAGQGIVVGGVVARDIRILHNTIGGAIDGIHVGLSTRGARTNRRFADRVQIVGNTISHRVPQTESPFRAGIFVGNVKYATVRDNRVESQIETVLLEGEPVPITRSAEAIRVWGVPGDDQGHMLLVTGNSSQHATIGIHVVQVGPLKADSLCRVTQNLAVSANTAIVTVGAVAIGPDNVPPP